MMDSEDRYGIHQRPLRKRMRDEAIQLSPEGTVTGIDPSPTVPGYALVSQPLPAKMEVPEKRPSASDRARLAEAKEQEELLAHEEPYAVDDEGLRNRDATALAYMDRWSHYEASYNATQHREMINGYIDRIGEICSAILGRDISDEAWDNYSGLLASVKAERARLLGQIEKMVDTVSVAQNSIDSLQKLIGALTQDALRGKDAYAQLSNLAVWMGCGSQGTPEQLADAIRNATAPNAKSAGLEIPVT